MGKHGVMVIDPLGDSQAVDLTCSTETDTITNNTGVEEHVVGSIINEERRGRSHTCSRGGYHYRRPAAFHCVHLAFNVPVDPHQLLLYGLTL